MHNDLPFGACTNLQALLLSVVCENLNYLRSTARRLYVIFVTTRPVLAECTDRLGGQSVYTEFLPLAELNESDPTVFLRREESSATSAEVIHRASHVHVAACLVQGDQALGVSYPCC